MEHFSNHSGNLLLHRQQHRAQDPQIGPAAQGQKEKVIQVHTKNREIRLTVFFCPDHGGADAPLSPSTYAGRGAAGHIPPRRPPPAAD